MRVQALRSKFGEGEWDRMTSQEKQKHLVEMKLAERKLRAEGRNDEANALFGDALHDDGVLEQLGVARSEQRREREDQLQRRRELKSERRAKGLSDDDAIVDVILEEEERQKPKKLVSL